jgi:hypothetical protein
LAQVALNRLGKEVEMEQILLLAQFIQPLVAVEVVLGMKIEMAETVVLAEEAEKTVVLVLQALQHKQVRFW